MMYKYDEYKSIFIIDSRITKDYFMQKCSVEQGSYAESLFGRMYDSIMSEIRYLDDEFDKFYKVEYLDFVDFLNKKYNIPLDKCEELLNIKRNKPTFKLCEKNDLACGHYQMYALAFSDNLIERIFDILQMNDYED